MREILPDKTAVDWPEFATEDLGVIVLKAGNDELTNEQYAEFFRRMNVASVAAYLEDLERDKRVEELEELTVPELEAIAEDQGIAIASSALKADIIAAIVDGVTELAVDDQQDDEGDAPPGE